MASVANTSPSVRQSGRAFSEGFYAVFRSGNQKHRTSWAQTSALCVQNLGTLPRRSPMFSPFHPLFFILFPSFFPPFSGKTASKLLIFFPSPPVPVRSTFVFRHKKALPVAGRAAMSCHQNLRCMPLWHYDTSMFSAHCSHCLSTTFIASSAISGG